MWYGHMMGCQKAFQKKCHPIDTKCTVKLEDIVLSEISQTQKTICFLWLKKILLSLYRTFFIHSSVDKLVGQVHFLAFGRSTAVNIEVQVCMWQGLESFEYVLEQKSFMLNLHTDVHSNYISGVCVYMHAYILVYFPTSSV